MSCCRQQKPHKSASSKLTRIKAKFRVIIFSVRYDGKGLGFWSEQAFESVHADFKKFWANRKVGANHEDFAKALFEAVLAYNARHI